MSSLDTLLQAVTATDPHGAFRNVSYALVEGNALPPNPWWVDVPFGAWPPAQAPSPSLLQNALAWAVREGGTGCFVDVTHLGGNVGSFFQTGEMIAELVKRVRAVGSGKAVIRYLVGMVRASDPNDGFLKALLASGAFGGSNVEVYYGSFTPGMRFGTADTAGTAAAVADESVSELSGWLLARLREQGNAAVGDVAAALDDVAAELPGWTAAFLQQVAVSLSWNHAKICAVNGTTLVTGGANYWNEYGGGSGYPFDLAMRITGPAAGASHRFADTFWSYLAKPSPLDVTSFGKRVRLDGSIRFEDAAAPAWAGTSRPTGSVRALLVGKNGNWPGPKGFPATLFDAARDFTINLLAEVAGARLQARGAVASLLTRLADDGDPEFVALLDRIGVNPAAWASRRTHVAAIAAARRSLCFSQQKFVLDDLMAVPEARPYQELVHRINARVGMSWDGFLWPYDTLRAMGSALGAADALQVKIVASYLKPAEGGYNDAASGDEFRKRLREVMEGMRMAGELPPGFDVPRAVARVAYARVEQNPGNPRYANHSKLTLVDDALAYVGSDNAYPCYNQEHGLWVDDPAGVTALVGGFWNGLWKFASPGEAG
ncbi:MAG TPA: hypothetical protein VJT67_00880 [Longimicrobiaceae bacterium]|nr:hypothetical protein [Longimicrobiaceae bacterium]